METKPSVVYAQSLKTLCLRVQKLKGEENNSPDGAAQAAEAVVKWELEASYP